MSQQTKLKTYEVSGLSRAGYPTKVRVSASDKHEARTTARRRVLVKVTHVIEVR